MKKTFTLLGILLIFSVSVFSADAPVPVSGVAASVQVFPQLIALSLDNVQTDITALAKGKAALFVLGFERKEQKELDAWLDPVIKAAAGKKDFIFFEVPMLDAGFAQLFAGFMLDGFKNLLPKEKASQAYIFFGDKARYMEILKVEKTSQVQVFLNDKAGNIIWKEAGAPSEAKLLSLFAALEKALK